jgi:hypothetical protein
MTWAPLAKSSGEPEALSATPRSRSVVKSWSDKPERAALGADYA